LNIGRKTKKPGTNVSGMEKVFLIGLIFIGYLKERSRLWSLSPFFVDKQV
jgi:hypothetical protein